ncbi:integral membrane family protein [Plectosphaerella plurivora]|uniref:Integral membrane family protein n=1 Tax=Plectosphaerella plurivora TaxID=936078 RepID=A0A9P9AA79_9PEZI|nr:integral membrane family protein [Plectosphaerella plurivora]
MAEVDLTENNSGALVVTAITFLVLSWLSVILRAYVRAILTKAFQADDWLMLVAQAIFTLSCVFILVGVHNGLGMHNKALEQSREIEALKYQALATATYVLDMMFIKLSVGIFLLRLTTSKAYIWTIYISLAVVVIWTIALSFWNIFQCAPVAAQWDYTIPGHTCVSPVQVVQAAYALSVMIILSDWLYALLPVPMVWKVKMTTPAKISVVMLLGLGIFASIATLIRLKFLADLEELDDILFDGTDAMVWTLVEPGIAIIAASLVTIRPLLRLLRLRGFGTTDRTFGYSGTAFSGQQSAGRMPGYGPGTFKMVSIDTDDQKQPPRPPGPEHKPIGNTLTPAHISPLAMSPYYPQTAAQSRAPPTDRLGHPPRRLDVQGNLVVSEGDSDEESGRLRPPGALAQRRSGAGSEMYVIEGARVDGPRAPSRSGSSSISSFDMVGMEANAHHSQHHARGMV